MLNKRSILLLVLTCNSANADSFSLLSEEINSKLMIGNEASNSCEQKSDSWPWTRMDMSIGASLSFGIDEVLELEIAPEVTMIWVKKGHEPD